MDASLVSRFNNDERKELNKSAIKEFAINARKKLIKGVSQKAYQIGISEDEIKQIDKIQDGARLEINTETIYLNNKEYENREKLIEQIKQKGFDQVMEEVAYTWFNRIIAIRFMEVNNYLPTEIRILSSEDEDKKEPDAVSQVMSIVDDLHLNVEKVYKFQDDNDVNGLFKYIFVKQCNALSKIMPVMFEKIEDYTELLLPDNLLVEGNVVSDLIDNIDEEDFTDQVQIIGWMYQYYISEKKDEVFAGLKKNKKITKENIPAATQLFTPDWIVRYMVENSLGRLWLEGHPDEELQSSFKYYLEEAEQEEDVQVELDKIKEESAKLSPEDITVLDPAMGSGHILVYAFDVLYQIYVSAGYSERDIPRLILEKNLYGLDIDDRAGQLAYFALMMRARHYSRRFLRDIEREPIELNVCSIQESNGISDEDIEYFCGDDKILKKEMKYMINIFKNAKEFGSIINMDTVDFKALENELNYLNNKISNLFETNLKEANSIYLSQLIKQGQILNKKYNVTITNPPYMGRRKSMNMTLSNYIDKNYEIGKMDMFSVFMEKNMSYTKKNGFIGLMTPFVWMFTNSYIKLRKFIIENECIINLIQLEESSFEDATVAICTFTLRNLNSRYKGEYIRLSDFQGADIQSTKVRNAVKYDDVYYKFKTSMNKFKKIPDNRIVYWISESLEKTFKKGEKLGNEIPIKQGITTSDNERFLRYWYEVNYLKIGFGLSKKESILRLKKWFPYNKGGKLRKWYGNNEYILNYYNNGEELKAFHNSLNKTHPGGRLKNREYYFKKNITWSDISGTTFGARSNEKGFLFDVKGSCAFPSEKRYYYILAFLNCKLIPLYINVLNPTVTTQVGDLKEIPIILEDNKNINILCVSSIYISKKDWDYFEISWDFEKHPLIEFKSNSIKISFNNWNQFTEKQFNQLKSNEEELNRIFIDIYGLQDELTPEVEDKDITIRKADRDREMKSFISYAVGCMMGRYSLDEEGLIYAGGDFDINRYKTFKADEDGIIPITDEEYFEDDIVSKFVDFVKIVFGQDSLEENLNYIADTPCFKRKRNETSRDCLRRYFLKGFMEDHIKVYQKRPIYWMFDSGKQNGFKTLIYMHRYDENMVAKVRTDYLHKMQSTYESVMIRLEKDIDSDIVSTREKTLAKKKREKIAKQSDECRTYDQVIAHVANERIAIDLDDGVKVNYNKFQGVEVPQGEGRKPLKADLLFKIKM